MSTKRATSQPPVLRARVGVAIGVRVYDGTALAARVRREGVSASNPSLHGQVEDNESLLAPIYYLSPNVGAGIVDEISRMIEGDPRFLHASMDELDRNYNYNDNTVLVQAIRKGYRGAYWDILRKVQEGIPP